MTVSNSIAVRPVHPWLRRISAAFVPGFTTPLLKKAISRLRRRFRLHGHTVQEIPDDRTDVILTTAPFGEPVGWRQALLFTARRRFKLSRQPVLYTLLHATPARFRQLLNHFAAALAKNPPDPADYAFPDLGPQAYRVLYEQGNRGGPILALERLVQAQSKSIHVILMIGEEHPVAAYHFDLVGAHPHSDGLDPEAFYDDIVLRIVTTLSTTEVTQHQVVGTPIPRDQWQRLSTPQAMCEAGRQLAKHNFFTEMVRIADLVHIPAIPDAVANQYSEGCFATWDIELGALIATVTGSARPVDKDNLTEDDLAVIVGVRPEGNGALVRHVEGKRNDPPSSEAVEMMDLDNALPKVVFDGVPVPVVRSKLHGHRGVAAYDPNRVEYVALDSPYYYYPVSCATDAQARGIKAAFVRSQALQNPDDPRQVVFTVLPTHGVVIVEKWVPGTVPFQAILECMETGALQIDKHIPQGPMEFVQGPDGRMVLKDDFRYRFTE